MVIHKRLDYGFNGYQVPPTPRAARSSRRRGPFRKKLDDNQMCAFDLLATVAGKLLLEGENASNSTRMFDAEDKCKFLKDSVKKEQQAEDLPEKVKLCDEGSCTRNFFVSELVSQAPFAKNSVMDLSHVQNDAYSGLASIITTDCSDKFESAAKVANGETKFELGNSATKVDVVSSPCALSLGNTKLDEEKKKNFKIEAPMIGKKAISSKADMRCSEDPVVWDRKPPALGSSHNSVKLPVKPLFLDRSTKKPFCGIHSPHGSFPASRDVKLDSRDDDENSFGCTKPITRNKAFRLPSRIGDRRIKRLLASKYWKVSPTLKDEERFSTGSETKSLYQNRINSYQRQRSLRDYPFKKRKLCDRSLVENSNGWFRSDGTSNSHGKVSSGDASGSSAARKEAATRASAPAESQQTSFHHRDTHVKLKIKSFRVPELFIEIPETETVGSLKRSVMEAVTAILSGGLHVGVLLQGKKIGDDNKTLLQTGIFGDNKIETLNFTLEPNSSEAPSPLYHENNSFLLSCAPQSLTRCPHTPVVVQQGISDVSPDLPIAKFGNLVESDRDSAPSPPDLSIDKNLTDSRALVAVPEMNVDALAVVPMQKSKWLDVGQRRIRRPFSVSEVEALVQAVEKLGTGRWRDVKLRAFDNAKHRTYVDLKDKWKTLVHTARISPQQRRGEPVPQVLLDRVLAAHAFWSQQQAKQQLKQHSKIASSFEN